jgi:hypothetical protein
LRLITPRRPPTAGSRPEITGSSGGGYGIHAPKPAARRRPSSSSGALPPPSQRVDHTSRRRGPRRPQPPLPTLASAASPRPTRSASNAQPPDRAGAPPDPEAEVAATTRRPRQECAGSAVGAAGSVPGGPPADRSTHHCRGNTGSLAGPTSARHRTIRRIRGRTRRIRGGDGRICGEGGWNRARRTPGRPEHAPPPGQRQPAAAQVKGHRREGQLR